MKTFDLSCLLLLLFSIIWDGVHCLCSLDKYTAALCHDLEDARYINTYHLHTLRAPSSSRTLSPGNFDNLTSLRNLDLSRGNIQIIQSNSFAKLGSLQTLNLADNQINHLEAGAFDGLQHVHSLTLKGNAIRQLPSALMSLKELKLLDISNNPLNCNCASMKLRDALIARDIKIAKKTYCSEPISVKYASIWKPDTKTTCLFEKQDLEMQRDQPLEDGFEGSGEVEEDEEETVVPPTTSAEISSSETTVATSSENILTDIISSSSSVFKDDITFEDTDDSSKKESTTTEADSSVKIPKDSEESDLIIPSIEPGSSSTSEEQVSSSVTPTSESTSKNIVPDEGSGESDDDAVSSEGSGIFPEVPAIDFTESSQGSEDEEFSTSSSSSSSSTTTTTESLSWFDSILNNLSPWSASATTEAPKTTEKPAEEELKDELFIRVVQEEKRRDEESKEKTIVTDEASSQQTPVIREFASNDLENNSVNTEPSQEAKKGIGSYVVLITLLVLLGILLGFAAYKVDFCRKKRKRRDVERGTEMKDMQRTLLDQTAAQTKIQALNGNTLENVPLMNSSSVPDEPKNNQKRYDISPAPVTNGSSRTNGMAVEPNDPVKPSRKSLKQDIEAPLNGLNPPMEAIDAPTESTHGDTDEIINTLDYCEKPPLTPGAHRVKIVLQENPDSVPKTPILITRVKDGENLVKKP